MARDDYGAINVISDEEREILGIGGSKKPDEEEKLFETIGKAADKIGETKVGQKIGAILAVMMIWHIVLIIIKIYQIFQMKK